MVECFIDSASAYEVILVLARQRPTDSYRTEWDQALEVTSLLISADQIKLSPSPRREGAASGAYGTFLNSLKGTISRIDLPDASTKTALRKTKHWANRNVDKLRRVLGSITGAHASPQACDPASWLEAHISHEWKEHVIRHGALFDKDFIPHLAGILEVSIDELERVRIESADPALVAELVKKRPDSDLFRLIRDAYVASSLLRGRYHNFAAEDSKVQILTHPIRDPILRNGRNGESIAIESSNTERYISSIALAGAFAEKKHQLRVSAWADNVIALRNARDQINLEPKDCDETAMEVAIDAAKKFGVRVHSRQLEKFLEVGFGLSSLPLASC